MSKKHTDLFAGVALWLALLLVYSIYIPAQTGVFHFDDEPNLAGLSQVHDASTALIFIATGEAGPLSRPVALASFLLNVGDWPNHPQGFLVFNILIHLLNGAILAWVVIRLLRLTCPAVERTAWIAVSAAALWMLTPLLASTSLIIVQRMTSLSATFVLGGLLTYLIGLSQESVGRIRRGRLLQLSGILLGTGLAALTKETGALLPLYALTLELTILSNIKTLSATKRWRILFLTIPVFLLFIYLVTHISPASFTAREFTLHERLMTQPLALWDYLRFGFIPRPSAFTPFHDDYTIARSLFDPPTAFLALIAWIALLLLALWQHKRWPWLSLAILWYLSGHALESTALPLELYFEHRNYLPVVGPILALAWLAWTAKGIWHRLGPILIGVYTLLTAAVLWQTTSLWGDSMIAAEIWAKQHPNSSRAQQFLAQRYVLIDDTNTALRILDRSADQNPKRIDLSLQALQLACNKSNENEFRVRFDRIMKALPSGPYANSTLSTFSVLLDLQSNGKCAELSSANIQEMLDTALANPSYQSGNSLHHLHHMKSRIFRDAKSLEDTMHHLNLAFDAKADIGTAVIIIGTLLSGGLEQEALDFIDDASRQAPLNPILRVQWFRLLKQLQDQIEGQSH